MSYGYGDSHHSHHEYASDRHSHREYAEEGHSHYNDPELYNLRQSVKELRSELYAELESTRGAQSELDEQLGELLEQLRQLRSELGALAAAHNEASATYGEHMQRFHPGPLAGLHPLA